LRQIKLKYKDAVILSGYLTISKYKMDGEIGLTSQSANRLRSR
jgi:hypothetical protein